jgi:hypothetical protein
MNLLKDFSELKTNIPEFPPSFSTLALAARYLSL